jgi:hypothetical protein
MLGSASLRDQSFAVIPRIDNYDAPLTVGPVDSRNEPI